MEILCCFLAEAEKASAPLLFLSKKQRKKLVPAIISFFADEIISSQGWGNQSSAT